MSDAPDPPPGHPPRPSPPPPPAPTAPSGWHPDPFGRHEHRWFDGSQWTDHVADDGVPSIDRLGITPGPPASQWTTSGTGKNGIAIAALVCGIIAVLIAWVPFVVVGGIVLGALALIFGIIGLRRSTEVGRGRGQAVAGIVTGGVALALAVVGVILSVVMWREVSDFLEPGPHDTAVTGCSIEDGIATVTGTLTNESTTERDYTLFVDVDGRTEPITLDDVESGRTVEWRAAVRVGGATDATETCTPDVNVNGPFPFGIELDPIDQ